MDDAIGAQHGLTNRNNFTKRQERKKKREHLLLVIGLKIGRVTNYGKRQQSPSTSS